jgi:hypothetical protein
VFLTFLLGGIWHGAGWTFVIWGALHGAYVVVNHLLRKSPRHDEHARHSTAAAWGRRGVTLLIVMVAWIFFRAKTVSGAMIILGSMGFVGTAQATGPLPDEALCLWMVVAAAIAMFAPNTQELTRYSAKLGAPLRLPAVPLLSTLRQGAPGLSLSVATAVLCGVLFAAALACVWRPAIFIYFNF